MASVLLTVYDREPEVLLATLRQLWRTLDEGDQVVVVNDGSKLDYSWVKAYAAPRFERFVWHDLPEYSAFRIGGGFNNPAKAFNAALERADSDTVFIMSSDVLVTPGAVRKAKKAPLAEMAWTPLVVDIDSGAQYCGPLRLFPAPWFFCAATKTVIDCGGWDENYLKGMCYEDNDFIGRVVLKTGRFLADWSVAVYHQSHPQPAYNVSDPAVKAANDRNREYTRAKWSGIPFGGTEDCAFDVLRKPYITGDVVHECKYRGTLLEDVIARTNSPFVGVKP